MDIRFTNHAKYRAEQRNISAQEIKDLILKPDSISFDNGLLKATKKTEKENRTVLYKKVGKAYIIITVY